MRRNIKLSTFAGGILIGFATVTLLQLLVGLASVTLLQQNRNLRTISALEPIDQMPWTGGTRQFTSNKTSKVDDPSVAVNMWYQEEEGEGKTLDPLEFFQVITQLGGEDWIKPRSGFTLDETGQRLVEIASQVGAAHLLRPVPPLPQDLIIPPKIEVDCSNLIYARALTGRKDPKQKIIIDAAPFGWDVDYLEIRLLEIGDLVHKVVVSEQDANHKGIPKPYFLVPKLLKDRLVQFASKVDFLPQNVTHLIPELRADPTQNMWSIEHMMRTMTVEHILQKYSYLEENDNAQVYVIQNDGDEIPERAALAHFKECELRSPDKKTWFPGFLYKHNVAYLQWGIEAIDMPLTGEQQGSKAHETLRGYVWANGPIVIPFKKVSAGTFRLETVWEGIHMGLGSANHFSNPAHPISGFLKLASTADGALGDSQMSSDFYKHALAGNLTNLLEVRNITHQCQASWRVAVKDMEDTATIQGILDQHLPWAVHKFGGVRYPWLYRPNILEEEKQVNDCLCSGKCGDLSPNSKIQWLEK